MSDDKKEYRGFLGYFYNPSNMENYPYRRKAGSSNITSFLFSTAALNGGDQTIKAEVWDGDLDTSLIKVGNLYYIHGEWNNKPYTNKEGEEVSPRQLSLKKVWDLGESIMSVGTTSKTAVKKRPVLVDDLDDDLGF